MISNRLHLLKLMFIVSILAIPIFPAEASKPSDKPAPGPPVQPVSKDPVIPKRCHRNVLIALGFEGHDKPETHKINMCPSIKSSCCTLADQGTMYSSWVLGLEEESLQNLFLSHQQVYSRLLDLTIRVNMKAKKTADRLKNKMASNCKVLARRISHFEITSIAEKLKDAIVNMHSFFLESYKGFYCAVCNAALHPFIDVQGKKFIFNQKFCRDITANSLHVLIYFHFHFAKYLNLVTRFVTSCKVNGEYKKDVDVKVSRFSTSQKVFKALDQCKKQRNDATWFEACAPVCSHFQATKFVDYFAPNLLRYHKYSRFLTKELNRLDKEEEFFKLLESQEKKKKRTRLLDEGPEKPVGPTGDPANEELDAIINDMLMFKQDPIAIRTAVDAGIDLDSYASRFNPKGIDLYSIGKMTVMSEAIYKSLKEEEAFKVNKAEEVANKGAPKKDNDGSFVSRIGVIAVIALVVLCK